jgi:hypothetical protein
MAKSMWGPGEYERFIGVNKVTGYDEKTLVSRTHFKKGREAISDTRSEWQWRWTKEAPNGEVVAVGGEGYDRAGGAVNGFFSAEGVPEWEPNNFDWENGVFGDFPERYTFQTFAQNHFVICEYKPKNGTEDSEDSDKGK